MSLHQTPEQMARDLRDLMGCPFGQRFLLGLLTSAGLNTTTHTGDALHSAFAEGRRSVAVDLASRLKAADFPAFLKIIAQEQETFHD